MEKKKVNFIDSFDGHEERAEQRRQRFNRKPAATKCKRFLMGYGNRPGKVYFKVYRHQKASNGYS